MNIPASRIVLLLCAASLLLAATPTSAADIPAGARLVDAPVPAPAVDGSIQGYDWASREDSTHILLDANSPAASYSLDDVLTLLMDVRSSGLCHTTDTRSWAPPLST